jgi:hypothetical protein
MASIFEVRPAGAAFDLLLRLGTPAITEGARAAIRLDGELARVATETVARLPEITNAKLRGKLKSKLMRRVAVAPEHVAAYPALAAYDAAFAARDQAEAALVLAIEAEYERIHGELQRAGTEALPDFFVIESDSDANDRLLVESMTHNKWDRQNDRTLALYLQRICAKNDTISRFGPSAWGKLVAGAGVSAAPRPAIARRCVELERWVIQTLADVMNQEPESRLEAAPRLHPHVTAGARVVRLDEDREIALSAEERAVLARCDGKTAAHALDTAILERLVERGAIVWAIEPFALDVSPLASLRADVDAWRDTPHRTAWQATLDRLGALAARFAEEVGAPARRRILKQLQSELEQIGVQKRQAARTLYQARNPLNENCVQDVTITIGAESAAALVAGATPWFDLYADAVGFAAARVFRTLFDIVREAPREGGRLAYSTLSRVARARRGASIEDDALQEQIVLEAWKIIKEDFSAQLAGRADAPEWTLTAEDCRVLRDRHAFVSTGALALPSADLQVIAASPEDAAAGRLDWIVSELHWGPALLQHSSYWCCPDRPALHAVIREIHDHAPFCARDAGRLIPVHVSGEATLTAMPSPTYAGSGRAKPSWAAVRPADAEVVVDEERLDILLRANGKDIGSIVRTVRAVGAMHPFFPFERVPHAPRLRVGNVIVQRQSWHVESSAFDPARPSGVSPGFVTALERMRADRGIPRWVFVRPAPGVLSARGWARDKDNKPIYVDLESAVFLDVLERRLRKYETLVFTEMLPAPDALTWTMPDGRYTYELRTNIIRGT